MCGIEQTRLFIAIEAATINYNTSITHANHSRFRLREGGEGIEVRRLDVVTIHDLSYSPLISSFCVSISFFATHQMTYPAIFRQSCCDRDTDYTSRNINTTIGKHLPIHV